MLSQKNTMAYHKNTFLRVDVDCQLLFLDIEDIAQIQRTGKAWALNEEEVT